MCGGDGGLCAEVGKVDGSGSGDAAVARGLESSVRDDSGGVHRSGGEAVGSLGGRPLLQPGAGLFL